MLLYNKMCNIVYGLWVKIVTILMYASLYQEKRRRVMKKKKKGKKEEEKVSKQDRKKGKKKKFNIICHDQNF